MNVDISFFAQLPDRCTYAIIANKKAYLATTNNLFYSLIRVLSDIRDGEYMGLLKRDLKIAELKILDPSSDLDNLYKFKEKLTKEGYKVTLSQKLPSYKVKIQIDDFKIFVNLVSRGKRLITCGVFNKMTDAKKFASMLKKQNPIRPIYATNNLTKEYLSSLQNDPQHNQYRQQG